MHIWKHMQLKCFAYVYTFSALFFDSTALLQSDLAVVMAEKRSWGGCGLTGAFSLSFSLVLLASLPTEREREREREIE
jgi:hypothetical protein